MIKEHKIPTIIGIVVLIFGLVSGIFLVQRGTDFLGFAQAGINPEQMKITNVSDTSFTISWITVKTGIGFISFGETANLGMIAKDDRDNNSNRQGDYFVHHVTLTSLKPFTKYYFKIGSGGKTYDNQGQAYTLTTAPLLSSPVPLADISSGTVLDTSNQASKDTLVYLSLAGTTPLSTYVKDSGQWIISLNNARTPDLKQYAQYDRSAQIVEIFIQGGAKGVSSVITTTNNDNPVPEIVLGKTYDFRQVLTTPSPTPETDDETSILPTLSPSKFSFQPLASPSASTELSIINPVETEQITTQSPEFFGTGPSDKIIQIQVESPQKYTDEIKVDKNNSWRWTPPGDLPPGDHKITITYLGKSIQRNFTVLAAGPSDNPAFIATPSGAISPTLTPPPQKIPTATSTPKKASPTPTASILKVTPTLTPTKTIPTPTASIIRTSMPSTTSGIPVSGELIPTYFVFIAGIVFISLGFLIKLSYLKSKEN